MALEDKGAQQDKVVVDKFHDPIADYQMTTYDYVLRPAADWPTGAIVITLPRVAEAKGRFYSIIARNADAVNTITITDFGAVTGDSECWVADIVLNGRCDRCLLYSDGLAWHPLSTGPGRWPGKLTTPAPGTSQPPTTLAPTTVAPSTAAPTTA